MPRRFTNALAAIMGSLLISVGALSAEAPSKAATAPGSVEASEVAYGSGEEQVTAYLAVPPESDGRRPALIVIHEWWGLDPWVKQGVERFAGLGYVALGVDLYRGRSTHDPDEAHELMRGLPEDRARRDLVAAFEYLRRRGDVDPGRIGAAGWCMGGGYSLVAALNVPDLRAAAMCYGRLAEDRDALSRIGASMLAIFGGKDRGIPVESVRAFEHTIQDLGIEIEVHVYPDSGHAFMNPNNAGGYNAVDAADAWRQIDAFFKRTLKAPRGG